MLSRSKIAHGILAVTTFAAVLGGQTETRLPPDIFPDSLSRLPLVKRDDMDEDGKRIYDLVTGRNRMNPPPGPGAMSLYVPKVAEAMHMLNQSLRQSGIGRRCFELCVLIAAWEFAQQAEWSAHEPAALRAGLEQSVIDVIKYDKDLRGLSEKDETVIRLGRTLLRDHRADSALWARTVELFGRQGAVEITAILGSYAMAAVMLTAVDLQIPPGRKPLLPPR